MKGYNTDFEIIIYNKNNELHDKIIGELPEGNPTIYDITHYLSTLLNGLINITYDKIKISLFLRLHHQMQIMHIYI
jgi:hypothetical protein